MGGDGTDRIPRPGRGRLLVEQEAPRPVARPARCTTRPLARLGNPDGSAAVDLDDPAGGRASNK
jgi:hypothetical protein